MNPVMKKLILISCKFQSFDASRPAYSHRAVGFPTPFIANDTVRKLMLSGLLQWFQKRFFIWVTTTQILLGLAIANYR